MKSYIDMYHINTSSDHIMKEAKALYITSRLKLVTIMHVKLEIKACVWIHHHTHNTFTSRGKNHMCVCKFQKCVVHHHRLSLIGMHDQKIQYTQSVHTHMYI